VADFASVSLTIALARVWAAIRQHNPQVPEVVLLPVPNPHGHKGVLGHFAALRWTARSAESGTRIHEVVVVAEHLDRSAEDIVGTLLHEAAHALNFERGVRDCSRSQYHNQQFKSAAEEVGLTVQQVPHYGFALTALLPETATRYAVETAGLSVVLMHRRDVDTRASTPAGGDTPTGAKGEEGVEAKGGRYKKASCACPWNIRVARATLAATVIRCETCGKSFSLAS
jgi:hypothetical protein